MPFSSVSASDACMYTQSNIGGMYVQYEYNTFAVSAISTVCRQTVTDETAVGVGTASQVVTGI